MSNHENWLSALGSNGSSEDERGLRDVIEALHEGVLITGPDGIEGTNQTLWDMFDTPPDQFGDPEVFSEIAPYDLAGTPIRYEDRATARVIRTGMPVTDQIIGMKSRDGHERWLSITAAPRIVNGKTIGAVTTYRDVTKSKLATDALAANEKTYRTLTEAMPIGIYRTDLEGVLSYVNPSWSAITGIPFDEAVGTDMPENIYPADLDMVSTVFNEIATCDKPGNCQYRWVKPDGEVIWLRVYGTPTHDGETGSLNGFIGSIEDITPAVNTRGELSRLAQIIERTSDLVGAIDPTTFEVTYLNRSARLVLGLSRDEARRLHATDIYTPEAIETFVNVVLPKLETYGSWTGDLAIKGRDGTTLQMTQTVTIQRNPDGSIREYSAIGRDTTEQLRMAAELEYRATHDSLTGLPNRSLLLDRISLALAKAGRDAGLVALIFFDIDRFKTMNDTYGHAFGDMFLRDVATRINETLRPGDTVARLGGDEFVVLIEGVRDELHALSIANRIVEVLESRPYEIDGLMLSTTVSGGIALSSGGPDEHADAILRDADAAMYRAKDQGRARLELFDETMRRRASERVELVDALAEGINSGEIEIHYQLIVDLKPERIIGVEALARWNHPTRGLVSPADFIPVAEESGLIVELGLQVLETACRQAVKWRELRRGQPLCLHVNLSARQLNASDLPTQVSEIISVTGVAPADLCLEITESALMENADRAIEVLDSLKQLGVSLAIDDFGTGYSSLGYLLRFPVDILKVDGSFVDGLGPETNDSIIVEAIIKLASTLRLGVVAEGVETDEQLRHLRDLGCESGQGYLFAKPLPVDEITHLLIQGREDANHEGSTPEGSTRENSNHVASDD